MVHVDKLKAAQDSYARCCATPDFFKTFYRILLESSPVIPVMFADTDFERQEKLLEHGLGLLMAYARHDDRMLLERLAIRHSREDLDVNPALYPLFVDSLIAAVEKHDPEYGAELGFAWRAAVAPGIEMMTESY
jgi:hemoglobin-like flavoprotein